MITKFKIFENNDIESKWLFLDELNDKSKKDLITFINFFIEYNHDFNDYSIIEDLYIDEPIYADGDKNKKVSYIFIDEIQYKENGNLYLLERGNLNQLSKDDLIKILKAMFRDRLADLKIDLEELYTTITIKKEYDIFLDFSYFFNKSYEIFNEPIIDLPKSWKEFLKQKQVKKFKI